MITAEIKVNGALIGYLYVVNVTDGRQELQDYKCEYYTPETGTLHKFTIKHDPKDMASGLMAKCFKVIECLTRKDV
jgi:hypothetical protein